MQLDEEHDDVKHMNQMTLYAKVVTVRDKQLSENLELEKDWVSEQKRLDLMMEIERLKALRAEDEREKLRVEAKRRGAAVIIEQIKEREVLRIREREQLEREKQQQIRVNQVQKEADQKIALAKKARNAQQVQEVVVSNSIALDRKADKLRKERIEDLAIARYNANRIAQEERVAAEAREIKEQKELEIQRLRELQERAADRQGEIDGLRAKRAFEMGERKARQDEKTKAALDRKNAIELDQGRRKQFVEREIVMASQAKAERDEFLRVIQKQKEQEDDERQLDAQRHSAFRNHGQTIR